MICKIGDRVRTTKNIRTHGFFVMETGYTGTIIGIYPDDNRKNICVEFDTYINGHDGDDTSINGKDGYCWWVCSEEITIIKNNKIVITTDGNETLARLYDGNKVIKTATAKCSPADAFNFETGAKIAFDRLFESKPAEDVKPPKFEVGERYAYNDAIKSGIIEITEKNEGFYTYKVIKGLHNDSFFCFHENSTFVRCLKHIEKPKCYNGKAVCIRNDNGINDFTVGKVYEFIDGQTRDNDGDIRPAEKITSLDYFKITYEFIPFVE